MGKSSQPVGVEEFKAILAGRSNKELVDDTMSYYLAEIHGSPVPASMDRSPQPASSSIPLQPSFRANLIDEEGDHVDIEDGFTSSEDDTKSFDFTGELNKLNESGASH